MRYLEFSTKSFLKEVTQNIVNQYRMVEAISDTDLATILQRVGEQLARELKTGNRLKDYKTVLKSHGFQDDQINKILAGISWAKGKKSADQSVTAKQTQQQSQPTADEQPTVKTSQEQPTPAAKLPALNDEQKKQATQAFNNLKNPYRGLDDKVESEIRQSGETALQAFKDQGSEAGYKALQKHIDYINKLIANHSSSEKNTEAVVETASGGSTGAGSVASVASPMGAVIRRMPPGQSFFAPTVVQQRKKTSKKAKKRKK
jgi:hypothetical protein